MILESILSCSYLFLTCGSCIYTLIRHSYVQYSKFLSHFVCACCGIATISTRSFIVFVYKLFFREYIFDPIIIQMQEERNKKRCNVLYELLGTLSMASLICSLYCHHGYYIIGVFVATSISIFDVFKLYEMSIPKPKEIKPSQFPYIPSRLKFTAEPRCTMFIWVLVSVCFAYSVGNNFALAANYPYLLTNWVFTPEGFYEGWTVRSTINDYMMAAYVICITEAFKF
ncbi:uncharacterized protein LOC117601817 [Osmia lignaria lignaria]|uniref:uncharacterized protein LOC117601817 n=1 Tax=Osmia lignaria lignaria TaxID=1437193 RepID=UPI0014792966|nr:uncharacterized protein LOC117601817 [Osmia lignaria]